jgi:hypothetical protein
MDIGISLTIDSESFKKHDGPKINYSDLEMDDSAFTLRNHPLLFEKTIKAQQIECFSYKDQKAFFKTTGGDFSFDIFAAAFYLLSRYEEYLPHKDDVYGRYAHQNSIAYKEGFLNVPIINYWIKDFAAALKQRFPGLKINNPAFGYTLTYDIDIAWSYINKGVYRNIGGFFRTPSLERLSVLTRIKKDPFDCYEFLRDLHSQYKLDPFYFFLVATSRGQYDKNISPYNHSMWQLIKRHAKKYRVGLHPSWKSNEKISILKKEKKILETAGDTQISASRQHYIKFSLPETFKRLIEIGITDDYSMGYGSINGFRASVASSFYWYNLEAEAVTSLRLHPFCFMDANSFYEQDQTAEKTWEELKRYYKVCKGVNGHLITIFHNPFLGEGKKFEGWKDLYVKFISLLQQ